MEKMWQYMRARQEQESQQSRTISETYQHMMTLRSSLEQMSSTERDGLIITATNTEVLGEDKSIIDERPSPLNVD